MNVLAICTFDETLQITVSSDKGMDSRIIKTGLKHSENLMPQIMKLLEENDLLLKDLNLLCCTRGPGSFTGLRIGMAALKGLSFGLSIPLVSVPTLEVLAKKQSYFDGAVAAVLDAKKERFYAAVFENGERKTLDLDCPSQELASKLKDYERALICGANCKEYANEVASLCPSTKILINEETQFLGDALIELAQKQYEAKGADDIGQGPTYIRKSDAEVAMEERLCKQEQ